MSKVITREQYQSLTDFIDVDRDLVLTDTDFDTDVDGHVSETEFHAAFDEAIAIVSTIPHPDSQTFDGTDIEEFKTSLTYNKFKQWGRFFAENPSETLTLRDDFSADLGHSIIHSGSEDRHEFSGVTETAEVLTVSRGTQQIPIYAPGAKKTVGDDEVEISDALSEVDPDVLSLVHSVTLNPIRNPADTVWERQYHTKGFYSYMTAGASGEITVYPSNQDPLYTNLAMQHEIGHVWSLGRWTTDTDSVHWQSWKTAVEQDGAAPTSYAKNALTEDFADSFSLYYYFRNNRHPAEADLAKLRGWYPELFKRIETTAVADYSTAFADAFPNRFAIIQEIAEYELTGPFALDFKQWESIHASYVAAERFEKAGKPDLAAREYENILAIDVNQNEAKGLLLTYEIGEGNDAYDSGNFYSAAIHYQKAYDLDPTPVNLKERLVGSCIRSGNECNDSGLKGRAIGYYERAYELSPKTPGLQTLMAQIYADRGNRAKMGGDYAVALSSYEKLYTLNPTATGLVAAMISCHKRLAAQAIENNREAEAKTQYEAVLQLDANDQEAADYVNGVTRVFGYAVPNPF